MATSEQLRGVSVCGVDDVPQGEGRRFELPQFDEPIAVFNDEGRYYTLSDTCSHAQASLADGYVENGEVECPLHSSCFNLATGAVRRKPATEPVRAYKTVVEEGVVHVFA